MPKAVRMELLCPLITVGTTSVPICRVVLPATITRNLPTIDITTKTTGVSEIKENKAVFIR